MSHNSLIRSDMTALAPDVIVRLGEGLIASGVMLALLTPEDELYFATPDFIEFYDIQPGQQSFGSIMRHCWESNTGPLIATDDIEVWLANANAKRRSQANRRFEVDMTDGQWMWINETTLPDGWMMLTITDVTPIKKQQIRLERDRDAAVLASETDDLTGLYSRGAVMRRLAQIVERASSTGETFCTILMDLDFFKSINDRFGHDGGDQVLIHFATSADQVLRDRDILGRVGGEEFLLIMPDVTQSQAASVMERLRAHLSDQRLNLRGAALRYTFSAGIAQWAPDKTVDSLYHDADQALYAAKEGGRNRVCLAS
jgi:diguanylate cyclase (GGDEF)-like protein